jgi:hypothetical protein
MRALALLALLLACGSAHAAKAVLVWTSPTHNTDGSVLTDLAGYKVLYRVKGATTWKVKTVNAGATTTTIWNLVAGTRYEFAVKSYNNLGLVGPRTRIVTYTPTA